MNDVPQARRASLLGRRNQGLRTLLSRCVYVLMIPLLIRSLGQNNAIIRQTRVLMLSACASIKPLSNDPFHGFGADYACFIVFYVFVYVRL